MSKNDKLERIIVSSYSITNFDSDEAQLPHLEIIVKAPLRMIVDGELDIVEIQSFCQNEKKETHVDLILSGATGSYIITLNKSYLRVPLLANQFVDVSSMFISLKSGKKWLPISLSKEVQGNLNELEALVGFKVKKTDSALEESNQRIISITQKEYDNIRIQVLHHIFLILQGNDEGLIRLYEYAQELANITEKISQDSLTPESKEALIAYEIITQLEGVYQPVNLVERVVDKETFNTINDFEDLVEESLQDLEASFTDILNENTTIAENTNTDVYANPASYLMTPSNKVPLLGNLASLGDKFNKDLYYSRNWNNDYVINGEDDSISKGEVLIIDTLLVIQRLYMLSIVLNGPIEDGGEDLDTIYQQNIFEFLIDSISQSEEVSDDWVFKEALKYAGKDPLFFQFIFCLYLDEYVIEDAIEDEDWSIILYSPYGQLLDWFGHAIISEHWEQNSLMGAFSNQPHMQEFISLIYEYQKESSEFTSDAIIELISSTDQPFKRLVKELGESVQILANMNALKNHKVSDDREAFIDAYVESIYL